MIVDDNPTILRLYSRLFQKVGFSAITATDGKEGLRIITEERPIAAVIDFNLPSLSGIEICEQVRSQEECRDMKLVLFTTDDRPETRTRALKAGANEAVIKSSEASLVNRSKFNTAACAPIKKSGNGVSFTPFFCKNIQNDIRVNYNAFHLSPLVRAMISSVAILTLAFPPNLLNLCLFFCLAFPFH